MAPIGIWSLSASPIRPQGSGLRLPYTKVAETPIVREKPFLQVDAAGNIIVRIPSLRNNSVGITWRQGTTPGKTIPVGRFYIGRPEVDTAATMNAALAKGKNLLLTPGIYKLTEAIRVTRPDTVVLGLGYATLQPVNGTAAMTTADVDGVIVAGLLVRCRSETITGAITSGAERAAKCGTHRTQSHCTTFSFVSAGLALAGRWSI